MRSRLTFLAGSAAAALVCFALPASAHHGWSGNTQGIELSGTVVRGVSLSGPHANMQIEDADGQVWDITLAPAPRTSRAGLREDTVPVGAEVTIMGSRNDDPGTFEVKTRRVSYNGENFDVYPANQ
jgi:hypothetical protein